MIGRRRRVGGGERGMSGPSGRCICSAAASAVNPHGWTPGYRHIQRDKHTLTYAQSVSWIRYSSVAPPRITSLSSSVYLSSRFLFQHEEENPTDPAFCCSLRSGI